MISIKTGVELSDEKEISKYDAILVGTNTYCSLANGFQYYVSHNYPYVFVDNCRTKYGDRRKIGTIIASKRDGYPTFVLCYVSLGYNFRPDIISDYLDYEALERCLKSVDIIYKGKKLATTLIGSTPFDGNGNREKILGIFNSNIKNVDLTIYDFEQKSKKTLDYERMIFELNLRSNDKQAYYSYMKEKKEKEKRLKELKNKYEHDN